MILWTAFCIIAVCLRGVRWDEEYEMAQVVLRQIPYPRDHPLFRCTRSALNLQIYTTSALLWLTHSPVVVCGFRNILYLMARVIPVFLIGSTLARNCLLGHVAAVLTLSGLPEEFHGSYPLHIWPPFSSTGPIGTGFALIIVYGVMVGAWRWAPLLLGLMPGIHIGQMPPPLAFAVLRAAHTLRTKDRPKLIRAAKWFGAGLAVCATMWFGRGLVSVPPPTHGPYYSNAPADAIWRSFVAHWDEHRSLPGGMIQYTRSFFILGAAILLLAAAARIERRRSATCGPWCFLLVYVAICAGVEWGIMIVHEILRSRIPYVLIAWMPYRFSNHVVLLLLAALPAMLMIRSERDHTAELVGGAFLGAALAFGMVRPILAVLTPPVIYARYLATGEGIFFALCGAASASLFQNLRQDTAFRRVWLTLQLAGLAALAPFHHFGAVLAAAGLAAGMAAPSLVCRWRAAAHAKALTQLLGPALAAACVLGLIAAVYPQWRGRQELPRTTLDRQISRYLSNRGEPHAMLVANPDEYSLQARTGHPILIDGPLALWISYMPSLGPTIQKILTDIFGIRFLRNTATPPIPWTERWRNRPVKTWQALAREYQIRYVLSPASVKLQLPEVIHGKTASLYAIPANQQTVPKRK